MLKLSINAFKCDDGGKSNHSIIFGGWLVCASLNINSLLSHVDELRVFMFLYYFSNQKESKLYCTVHNKEVNLPGFS